MVLRNIFKAFYLISQHVFKKRLDIFFSFKIQKNNGDVANQKI